MDGVGGVISIVGIDEVDGVDGRAELFVVVTSVPLEDVWTRANVPAGQSASGISGCRHATYCAAARVSSRLAALMGTAKETPTLPLTGLAPMVLTPTTSPRALKSGPPELPGLTAASV